MSKQYNNQKAVFLADAAYRKEKYYVSNITAFIKVYTDFRWDCLAYIHGGMYYIGDCFFIRGDIKVNLIKENTETDSEKEK